MNSRSNDDGPRPPFVVWPIVLIGLLIALFSRPGNRDDAKSRSGDQDDTDKPKPALGSESETGRHETRKRFRVEWVVTLGGGTVCSAVALLMALGVLRLSLPFGMLQDAALQLPESVPSPEPLAQPPVSPKPQSPEKQIDSNSRGPGELVAEDFDLYDKRSISYLNLALENRSGSTADQEAALYNLNRVIELEADSPNHALALLLRLKGELLFDQERYREAIVALEESLALGSANYGLLLEAYDYVIETHVLSSAEVSDLLARKAKIETLVSSLGIHQQPSKYGRQEVQMGGLRVDSSMPPKLPSEIVSDSEPSLSPDPLGRHSGEADGVYDAQPVNRQPVIRQPKEGDELPRNVRIDSLEDETVAEEGWALAEIRAGYDLFTTDPGMTDLLGIPFVGHTGAKPTFDCVPPPESADSRRAIGDTDTIVHRLEGAVVETFPATAKPINIELVMLPLVSTEEPPAEEPSGSIAAPDRSDPVDTSLEFRAGIDPFTSVTIRVTALQCDPTFDVDYVWTARDDCGNGATMPDLQQIFVDDTTVPDITCPMAESTGAATDECGNDTPCDQPTFVHGPKDVVTDLTALVSEGESLNSRPDGTTAFAGTVMASPSFETDVVVLDGSGSFDTDDDSLTFQWSLIQTPDPEEIAGPSTRLLAVGIDSYVSWDFRPLDYAVSDAQRVARAFENLGYETELLLEEQATKGRILDELRREALNSRDGDRTVIYFAGHGFSDSMDQPAVVTADGQALALEEIRGVLAAHRGEAVVIVDSCFNEKELPFKRYAIADPKIERRDVGSNVVEFLAGSVGQEVLESHTLRGGLYSHALTEALEQLVEVKHSGAVVPIDFHQLFAEVAAATEKLARTMYGTEQTPVTLTPTPGRPVGTGSSALLFRTGAKAPTTSLPVGLR